MVFKLKKSQYVELYVPSTATNQQQFNFPDQPQLRNAVLMGISVYSADDVTKTPTGKTVVSTAILKKSFITLFIQNADAPVQSGNQSVSMGEYVNRIPLVEFHTIQQGTNPFTRTLYDFGGLRIDWAKSYITTADAIGTGDISFLITVLYHNK